MFWGPAVGSSLILLRLINMVASNVENIANCFDPNLDYKSSKKLNVFYFKLVNNIGPNACSKECLRHGNCLAVNYNRNLFDCQLLSQKSSEHVILQNDKDYIYMEIPGINDRTEKKCSDVSCNYYSTCIRTLYKTVCIATECAEDLPTLRNGEVTTRVYSPHFAVYGCRRGYYALGSVNTINCLPGGKWGSLSYQCMTPNAISKKIKHPCNTVERHGCLKGTKYASWVHGGFSGWGGWTSCTKTCGTGTRTRSRHCNNPAPKYGGNGCKGNSTETGNCNDGDCTDGIVGVVLDVID